MGKALESMLVRRSTGNRLFGSPTRTVASRVCRCCARQRRGAAFTPLQGVSSKGHGSFNGQGCCQGEGIHPGRAMEREEIAAADGLERKRRERRAPTTCGGTESALEHPRFAGWSAAFTPYQGWIGMQSTRTSMDGFGCEARTSCVIDCVARGTRRGMMSERRRAVNGALRQKGAILSSCASRSHRHLAAGQPVRGVDRRGWRAASPPARCFLDFRVYSSISEACLGWRVNGTGNDCGSRETLTTTREEDDREGNPPLGRPSSSSISTPLAGNTGPCARCMPHFNSSLPSPKRPRPPLSGSISFHSPPFLPLRGQEV